ncbi:MAG: SdrD B-like domain-containing protein [Chloroflexota bacterium]
MKILSFASMSRHSRIYARIGFILTIFSLTFANLWVFSPVHAACTVGGIVYQDYNAGGTQDAAEPGVAGILVTAYQTSVVPAGSPPAPIPSLTVGTATTDANGQYTLTLTVTGQVRIEFTQIPAGLESGRFGAGNNSSTTTTFVDCTGAVTGVDLAVNNPGEFCHIANPQLATSCYVINDQLKGPQANEPTFVAFPYDAQDDPTPLIDPLIHQALAKQTGSTWGLAYHRGSDSFLVGSYMKRHAGLGPNAAGTGTTAGAIYRITPGSYDDPNPVNIAANVKVSVFADLGAAAGADPHPTSATSCAPNRTAILDCWQFDTATWPLVSKAGLGDVDISEDDKRLYAVNLFNRTLVEIPVIQSPTGITAGAARTIPLTAATIPDLGDPVTGCANFASDWRPFGLGMHLGMVYLGAVCSAESTQQAADLRAYVYKYDPLNPGLGFTQVLAFRLDYPRRCADKAPGCVTARAADWKPWSDTWPNAILGIAIRPEPVLTDITFDGPNMILAFRDRMGDRTGNERPQPFSPTSDKTTLWLGIAAGDILRACPDPTGAYVLENNGVCGTIPATAGTNNTQGPGNGEYYYDESNDPSNSLQLTHDEITIGGMVDLPGADRVAVTAFDPIQPGLLGDNGLFDGGVIWLDNTTGARAQSFRIFNGDSNIPTSGSNFGKSNGLGDLEAVCGPPPLEIGNRVWVDLDRNGVQDPGEAPIPNVRVRLYMIADSFGRPINQLIGQTLTDTNGEYYFNETNLFTPATAKSYINFWDTNQNGTRELHEPIGVMPRAVYDVRLDDPANYGAGAPLDQYYITSVTTKFFNDANDIARDSNGRDGTPAALVSAVNFPQTRLTTGDFGDNDHTYDFGFAQLPPPSTGQITQNGGGSGGLTVTKGVDKPFAAPGDTVTWTIHVQNTGTTAVSPVHVQDTLPSTLIINGGIKVSPPTGTVSVSGNTVTFDQAVMNPGDSVTITITTTIDPNITVPFIIVNQVEGYDAQAQVLSVSRLPNTGESPWSGLQIPILVAVASGIGLTGLFVRRRLRRSTK